MVAAGVKGASASMDKKTPRSTPLKAKSKGSGVAKSGGDAVESASKKGTPRGAALMAAISELTNPKPLDFDPEDVVDGSFAAVGRGRAGDEEDTSEHDEFGAMPASALRKPALLEDEDPKYRGRKLSRRDLESSDDEGFGGAMVGEMSSSEEVEEEEEDHRGNRGDRTKPSAKVRSNGNGAAGKKGKKVDESEESGDGSGEGEGESGDEEGSDAGDMDEGADGSFGDSDDQTGDMELDASSDDEGEGDEEMGGDDAAVAGERELLEEYKRFALEEKEAASVRALASDADTDVEKGRHARTQIEVYDALLEGRIRLQAPATLANRMPQGGDRAAFARADARAEALYSECVHGVRSVIGSLLELQEILLKSNPETAGAVASRKRPREDADTEDIWQYIQETDGRFVAFRDQTIAKWSNKTRIVAGGSALHGKKFKAINQGVSEQIAQALLAKDRLVRKSQLKRTPFRVLGKPETAPKDDKPAENAAGPFGDAPADELSARKRHADAEEYDEETFDDADFYHALLRELIERKSAAMDPDDPMSMGRQWLEVQKLRIKTKRKVDTKASKGRKLRYEPHPKIVNFMAPVELSVKNEAARTELFASLFGRMADSTEKAK